MLSSECSMQCFAVLLPSTWKEDFLLQEEFPPAGATLAMLVGHVNHVVLSVLLAVRCCLAALKVEARYFRAGAMGAALAANLDQALVSMLPAVRRCLAALDIEE